MTSQEAKGSFMEVSDVIKYFILRNWNVIFRPDEFIEIDGILYLPTLNIQSMMEVDSWRTMQSKVTTSMFGLNSIII